jgi:hypothetical protein
MSARQDSHVEDDSSFGSIYGYPDRGLEVVCMADSCVLVLLTQNLCPCASNVFPTRLHRDLQIAMQADRLQDNKDMFAVGR